MRKIVFLIFVSLISVVMALQITDFSYGTKSDINKYGKVIITRESDNYSEKLDVNHSNIDVSANKDDFYLMNLATKITLNKAIIYVVWGGTGGTIDQDSNKQCKFLVVESGVTKISQLTYCKPFNQNDYLSIGANDLITIKYNNIVAYAESNDIGMLTYNYKDNKITIVKPIKSDVYYKNKFAKLTSQQIYLEALANYGVVESTGFIDMSHVNRYGERYCFKFRSLSNPTHDKYYELLKQSCTD